MESSKIMMFPEMGNSGIDPNLMLALNNNGGFGGNNRLGLERASILRCS